MSDRPQYEVADIFHEYLEEYLRTHNLSSLQLLALRCIMNCRTSELGAHKLKCNNCGYEQIEYNSCRNRHCPKCQGSKRMKWVQNRLEELLPIPYYHCVFTLPHSLNPLTLYNKRVIYDLFFQAASYTLHTFSKDPQYLGARGGFIGILHSWGQNLSYHVHLHFIIAGGGLSHDGKKWIGLPYQHDFLFPVKAMSQVMRQKFRELLDRAYEDRKLVLDGDVGELKQRAAFEKFLDKVAWEKWVIYIKKPFCGPEEVLKYIGRYTHRVAISNQRVIDIADGRVSFRYKIYKDHTVTPAILTLSATEFIHRFLLHILPDGFKKIRYFGFLSNGIRRCSIALIRELIEGLSESVREAKSLIGEWVDKITRCPQCGAGELIYDEVCALPLLKPG
jgi:predicted Zn-ribbon and HTH transcriptional regulator